MPDSPPRPRVAQVLRDLRDLPAWARRQYLRTLVRPRTRQLASTLGPDARVLVLCHGNILRSPFAAALLRRELEQRGVTPTVQSAGLFTDGGQPAHRDALALAPQFGVALDSHRSTPLTAEALANADLVVVMDRLNEALLRTRAPALSAAVVWLGDFDPEGAGEIRDPLGEGAEVLQARYARIARAARELARALCDGMRPVAQRPAAPRRAVAVAAFGTPAVRLWRPFARSSAAIFVMHRFSAAGVGVLGESPQALAENLEFLRRHRYNILSVDELVARLDAGTPLPPRSVAFTIDDGYRDVLDLAAPVFAAYDAPYTVYLVTGFLDGRCWLWWDRVLYAFGYARSGAWRVPVAGHEQLIQWQSHAERRLRTREFVQSLKGLPTALRDEAIAALETIAARRQGDRPPSTAAPLTWEEVRRMRERGASFGPHTDTHPILTQCSADEAQREVQRSVQRFTEELGAAPLSFAYPNGTGEDFDQGHRAAVREAGLRAAVAYDGRYLTLERFREDRYALPRLMYESEPLRFRQLVSGVEQLRTGTWRR